MPTTLTATPADPNAQTLSTPADTESGTAASVDGAFQSLLNWVAWLRARTPPYVAVYFEADYDANGQTQGANIVSATPTQTSTSLSVAFVFRWAIPGPAYTVLREGDACTVSVSSKTATGFTLNASFTAGASWAVRCVVIAAS